MPTFGLKQRGRMAVLLPPWPLKPVPTSRPLYKVCRSHVLRVPEASAGQRKNALGQGSIVLSFQCLPGMCGTDYLGLGRDSFPGRSCSPVFFFPQPGRHRDFRGFARLRQLPTQGPLLAWAGDGSSQRNFWPGFRPNLGEHDANMTDLVDLQQTSLERVHHLALVVVGEPLAVDHDARFAAGTLEMRPCPKSASRTRSPGRKPKVSMTSWGVEPVAGLVKELEVEVEIAAAKDGIKKRTMPYAKVGLSIHRVPLC